MSLFPIGSASFKAVVSRNRLMKMWWSAVAALQRNCFHYRKQYPQLSEWFIKTVECKTDSGPCHVHICRLCGVTWFDPTEMNKYIALTLATERPAKV